MHNMYVKIKKITYYSTSLNFIRKISTKNWGNLLFRIFFYFFIVNKNSYESMFVWYWIGSRN
jgi:hypothetical protein